MPPKKQKYLRKPKDSKLVKRTQKVRQCKKATKKTSIQKFNYSSEAVRITNSPLQAKIKVENSDNKLHFGTSNPIKQEGSTNLPSLNNTSTGTVMEWKTYSNSHFEIWVKIVSLNGFGVTVEEKTDNITVSGNSHKLHNIKQ